VINHPPSILIDNFQFEIFTFLNYHNKLLVAAENLIRGFLAMVTRKQ